MRSRRDVVTKETKRTFLAAPLPFAAPLVAGLAAGFLAAGFSSSDSSESSSEDSSEDSSFLAGALPCEKRVVGSHVMIKNPRAADHAQCKSMRCNTLRRQRFQLQGPQTHAGAEAALLAQCGCSERRSACQWLSSVLAYDGSAKLPP